MAVIDAATAAALAEELYDAERHAVSVTPPSERHPGLDLVDAYAIQLRGRALRVADGATLVGRKVGLTSVAMQELLGVGEPDFGYLTDAMLRPDGARLARDGLVAPRVEAEIAFRLRAPLGGPDVGLDEALAAIGEIAPALEVVDSRVADWRITLPDTVADNASSGLAVIGAFRPLGETDLAAVEMVMDVARADGGAPERVAGRGDAVLGHPAQALAWLARTLAPFGESIAAGEIVIPGAMAAAVSVQAGDHVTATFTGLGAVSAHFEASEREST
jgi:2-keto-4-pentenoate hydratase